MNKSKHSIHKEDEQTLFAASSQETTGLIPAPARDAYEAANYDEITPYLPPTPQDPADGIQKLDYRTHVTPQSHLK